MLMIPLVLFAAAFVVRVVVGGVFVGPAYPDSYYYAHVAQQLAAGDGLVVDYLWNLDDAGGQLAGQGVLPVAANALWMPLAEVVQVPFIWLLGPTAVASALPFWLVGAFASPLTYWIGRDALFEPAQAAVAGAMVAVPGGLTPFVSQPDTFALFMVLGAASLWLCARGARGDRRAFVLGGLIVGLATLSRADGVLLGLPFALVFAYDLARRGGRKVGWLAALGCAGLFAIVLAPWLYRQYQEFGAVMPASGRLIWLTDYQQLFSFGDPPSVDGWLSQGLGWIVSSRIGGLLAALGLFALLPLAVVFAPVALIGAWRHRAAPAFVPFFVYAVALFAAMGLLFAIVVPHGTFLHSASALVPHTFLLVVSGVAAAVAWVAQRRRTWSPGAATRIFLGAAVVIALMVGAVQTASVTGHWSEVRATQLELATALHDAPASDRFMSVDPGAINYLTGRQGIVTNADGLPVIEAALRAYEVRWLLLESRSIVPALAPVLTGSVRPSWLSDPVAVVAAQPGATTGRDTGSAAIPAGALFAVCLTTADTRCAE
jgi:4-amino-4-deoxy-L-arabinose transferase-like glycosyltransferase